LLAATAIAIATWNQRKETKKVDGAGDQRPASSDGERAMSYIELEVKKEEEAKTVLAVQESDKLYNFSSDSEKFYETDNAQDHRTSGARQWGPWWAGVIHHRWED
jgi:hypothetical protein